MFLIEFIATRLGIGHRGFRFVGLVWSICLWGGAVMAVDTGSLDEMKPLLREHCYSCHSAEKMKGDLDLERFSTWEHVAAEPEIWQAVAEQLETGEMPPRSEPTMDAERKRRLAEWVNNTLETLAKARSADPGPVSWRKLSVAEYTYSIQDLTGVPLDPLRDFPLDGAAGEGFTNAAAALVISPGLLAKYLEAAKDTAQHLVLLPEGCGFSRSVTPSDWTTEVIEKIRGLYARYTTEEGASEVNLQGIKLQANRGGRLPLRRYLQCLAEAPKLPTEWEPALADRARQHGLSPKYLHQLRRALWPSAAGQGSEAGFLLAELQRAMGHRKEGHLPTEVLSLIQQWQARLWRFSSIGHIGKRDGPKAWQEPVSPQVPEARLKLKLPSSPLPGPLVVSGQSLLGVRHPSRVAVRRVAFRHPSYGEMEHQSLLALDARVAERRQAVLQGLPQWITAWKEGRLLAATDGMTEAASRLSQVAGIGGAPELPGRLLRESADGVPGAPGITGWVGPQALSLLANSSEKMHRIPGSVAPRSLVAHPAPDQAVCLAYVFPEATEYRVEAEIRDAHTSCGNGVRWTVWHHGRHGRVLAQGQTAGETLHAMKLPPDGEGERFQAQAGEACVLRLDPMGADHTCDLTHLQLVVHTARGRQDATQDLVATLGQRNPHGAWHIFSQPTREEPGRETPSPFGTWLETHRTLPAQDLVGKVSALLTEPPASFPEASVERQLASEMQSPLGSLLRDRLTGGPTPPAATASADAAIIAPDQPLSLALPSWVPPGTEILLDVAAVEGASLLSAAVGQAPPFHVDASILCAAQSPAWGVVEAGFQEFRSLFPLALCYADIIPVDEVVTLRLFYREDESLQRLMLTDDERAQLDAWWGQLTFVSQSPLKQLDAYEQLYQYATQDADPSAFVALRPSFEKAAADFRAARVAAEPRQVDWMIAFAERAWRAPLSSDQRGSLRALYEALRAQQLPHEAAIRQLLTRVLVSPSFLYRGEVPPAEKSSAEDAIPPTPLVEAPSAGQTGAPPTRAVSPTELAARLSFFLWSSTPDAELHQAALHGTLTDPAILQAQVQRLLADEKIARLSRHFGAQWLQVQDVARLDEKSARHFPDFPRIREALQSEVERFFTHLFQHNGSVLSLLDADHSFINADLQAYYGLPHTPLPADRRDGWLMVQGMKSAGRGGILGFGAVLAKQSGASRTSPILRGTWLSEVILGEKLPKPPKGIPILPEEAPAGLTERELILRHSSDPQCMRCHQRIDPFGFALEHFDPVGRRRQVDHQGEFIRAAAVLFQGPQVYGLEGLREYLVTERRADFVAQFCRKLAGFALGRAVLLSDHQLLQQMQQALATQDYRVHAALHVLIRSPQFQRVRDSFVE